MQGIRSVVHPGMARAAALVGGFCVALAAGPACDGERVAADAEAPGDADATADATPDVPDATDFADAGDSGDAGADAEVSRHPSLGPAPEGAGPLFRAGCPLPGRAYAGPIEDPEQRMEGPDAVGGVGDWLLMNDRAAFIITGLGPQKTYYYYPGILADAVAIEGCAQTGQERFGEIALLMGAADLGDFARSVLRAFHGTEFEVVSDGSDGGEARLRVRGTDDRMWLVELELIKRVALAGEKKLLSQPLGVEWTLDYVLEPQSRSLRMELTARNLEATEAPLLAGAMVIFGDTTRPVVYRGSSLGLGGFNLTLGFPWLGSTGPDGAWALGMEGAELATANISGVDALLDVETFVAPPVLGPAGAADDSFVYRFYASVGDDDMNSAASAMLEANEGAWGGVPYVPTIISGQVSEAAGGEPVPGASVEVQMQSDGGSWQPVDVFRTDADGAFGGPLPELGVELRAIAKMAGRADSAPTSFRLGEVEALDLRLEAPGELDFDIRDEADRGLPARITLWKGAQARYVIFSDGMPDARAVVPGDYEVSVTRGFEYGDWQGTVTVPTGGSASLAVALPHLVDTTGWLSADSHMHAGPSADSDVLIPDRIRSAAAEGLDVAVGTDHEYVSDWRPAIVEAGLGDWIAALVGQEVTATLPEHTMMYGLEPLPPEEDPRGGPVRWYGLDLGQIFDAERARGAAITQLNHPRQGCNWMCVIGYDRLTGEATETDPTRFGLPAEARLWTWNFDVVEYQNGNRDPFVDPAHPDETGFFDDWQSFLNLGHRITAVGVTDVHGLDLGSPRSYFPAASEDIGEFRESELTSAYAEGRVLVSTGAFARVSVGDAGMGDTVVPVGGAVALKVHIEALPGVDVTHFKVFSSCDEVLEVETTAPDAVVKYDGTVTVPVSADTHLTVLGFGTRPLPRGLEQFDPRRVPRFTTNAIYVDADDDGTWTPPGGKTCTYDVGPP